MRGDGGALLSEARLHRGPTRLHGKTQAGLHGYLIEAEFRGGRTVRSAIALSLSLAAALAAPAHANITAITIEHVEDFAGGASFGEVGAYERVSGKAKGELDPKS